MQRRTLQTLSLIFTTLLIAPFAAAADSPTGEQEALMQRERDIGQAMIKRDAKTLAEWEADEYVFTNFDGVVSDKAVDLAGLKDGTLTVTAYSVDDMKAMVYGNAGVVVGRQTQKAKYQGKDMTGTFRFTDTYVKRDGRWQCVAGQATRIGSPVVSKATVSPTNPAGQPAGKRLY